MAATQRRARKHAQLERGFEFSRLQDQWMATAYACLVATRPAVRRAPPPERSRAAAPDQARCHHAGGQSA
jgi:hypothetical protein